MVIDNNITILTGQFEEVRDIIVSHQCKALQEINREDLQMRWEIGQYVSFRLKSQEWGSKVVTQLSEYLSS